MAPPAPDVVDDVASKTIDGSLRFSQVMNGLQTVYPKQAMSDISTSYCFICLDVGVLSQEIGDLQDIFRKLWEPEGGARRRRLDKTSEASDQLEECMDLVQREARIELGKVEKPSH